MYDVNSVNILIIFKVSLMGEEEASLKHKNFMDTLIVLSNKTTNLFFYSFNEKL
jgi:hypothetical protein